jgi:O-antigen/teichoic acid export membrane protein
VGTDVAATRLYFDRADHGQRRDLLASWYAVALALALPAGIALILASSAISRSLFGADDWAGAVALTGLITIVGLANVVSLGVMRTTGRPQAYAILEGGALVANAFLAIGFLIWWRADATAVLLALALSWGGAALVGLWIGRTAVLGRPNAPDMAALLRLGLPLAPAAAIAFGTDFYNRAYLLGTAGAFEAGLLSIALRIASVATLAVTAVELAWHPHAYALLEKADARQRLGVEARQIVVLAAASVGMLGLATPEIVAVIGGGRFEAAGLPVALALAGVLGTTLLLIVALPSVIARRTSVIATAASGGVLIGAALNAYLAPRFGASGTALAIAAGQFIAALLLAVMSGRGNSLPVGWARVGVLCGWTVAAVSIGQVADSSIALRGIAAVVFLGGLFVEGTARSAVSAVRPWLGQGA